MTTPTPAGLDAGATLWKLARVGPGFSDLELASFPAGALEAVRERIAAWAPQRIGGGNMSPELNWGPGPAGTKSYVLCLHDTSNGNTHWCMWNIPAATVQLPANLARTKMPASPAGSSQDSFSGDRHGLVLCPYGYRWILSARVRDQSAAETEQRFQDWVASGAPIEQR